MGASAERLRRGGGGGEAEREAAGVEIGASPKGLLACWFPGTRVTGSPPGSPKPLANLGPLGVTSFLVSNLRTRTRATHQEGLGDLRQCTPSPKEGTPSLTLGPRGPHILSTQASRTAASPLTAASLPLPRAEGSPLCSHFTGEEWLTGPAPLHLHRSSAARGPAPIPSSPMRGTLAHRWRPYPFPGSEHHHHLSPFLGEGTDPLYKAGFHSLKIGGK